MPKKEPAGVVSTRMTSRTTIAVAIIGLISALVVAYWQFGPGSGGGDPPEQIEYVGRVIDASSLQPIGQAEITLELKNVPPIVYTDNEGVYRFTVAIASDTSGRIRVDAPGYPVYTRSITISPNVPAIEDIRLMPVAQNIAPTVTPTDLPTATAVSTPTAAPETRYNIFDDFNVDGALDGHWSVGDDPAGCTSKRKTGGVLLLECHSITTGKTEYSIYPQAAENKAVKAVSISANVENPVTDTWGKLQLKINFSNPTTGDARTYLMSQRGGIVYVVEYDAGFNKIASTSVVIQPGQFHILDVNYEDQSLKFLVDGAPVDYQPTLTPEFEWTDWDIEVFISQQEDESKVLKAQIDWVAIQP